VDDLRETVQKLARLTAPLGKMLDFYQEDMDSMNREMLMWKEEVKKHQTQLDQEMKYQPKQLNPH
jgi:TRAF3-interacting protein 1